MKFHLKIDPRGEIEREKKKRRTKPTPMIFVKQLTKNRSFQELVVFTKYKFVFFFLLNEKIKQMESV